VFADSDLANQAVAALKQLLDNVAAISAASTVPLNVQAAEMVTSVIPQIQGLHDIAARRGFTRLEPWLAEMLSNLNVLASDLSRATLKGGDRGGKPVTLPLSGLFASPLENLVNILSK